MPYGPSVSAFAVYMTQYQLLPYQRTAEVLNELAGLGDLNQAPSSALLPSCWKMGCAGKHGAKDSISPTRSRLTPGLQRLHADTVRATLFWRVQTHQCRNGLGPLRPPILPRVCCTTARHLPGGWALF